MNSRERREHYESVMNRGRMPYVEMPPPIKGMEGPFRYKGGEILYYDPREGKYYDRGADMYLSDRDVERIILRTARLHKQSAGGMYGFTKAIQKDVEVALRRLEKKVDSLARFVESKHPEAGSFFMDRGSNFSCPASQALGDRCLVFKRPSRVLSGPMGYKPSCAKASHKAICDLMMYAGEVATGLYHKNRNHLPYLERHIKESSCPLTRLLLEAHPIPMEG